MAKSYDEKHVTAFFKAHGIPEPMYEHKFAPLRKWRMDIAWIQQKVYCEVQGGIWLMKKKTKAGKVYYTTGAHTKGKRLLKEWEKINTASTMGWRPIFVQPTDLLKQPTIEFVKAALLVEEA